MDGDQIQSDKIQKQFQPKRFDVFKDENIIFEDAIGGDLALEDEQELEREAKVEQYRRRFEEALIRIEDQEDVVAMQDAKREINANDDEDLNEFDETNIDGEAGGETGRTKEELEQLRDQALKQNINDGISLKQGEIKKHEPIDWNNNSNINLVTRQCLNYTQLGYSFDEYLDERSKKDPKFVNVLKDEEPQINSQE